MVSMDRLLDLLVEAMHGADCGCSVTARAYLRMALEEWYRLIDAIPHAAGRDRLRKAALYASDYVSRKVAHGRVRDAAYFAFDFWNGYDDGMHQRTLPNRTKPAYRRGYRFAQQEP